MQILRMAPISLLLVALPAYSAQTAFINVNVVPMTADKITAAQTVIIEDREIVTIGDVDTIPIGEDTFVIDGTDRYLMPGLAEMHAHIPRMTS